MTSIGHEAQAAKIAENLKRKAQVTNKTEIIQQTVDDNGLRRDIASALESIAVGLQGELHSELDKFKAEIGTVLTKLNEAAEAELRRVN